MVATAVHPSLWVPGHTTMEEQVSVLVLCLHHSIRYVVILTQVFSFFSFFFFFFFSSVMWSKIKGQHAKLYAATRDWELSVDAKRIPGTCF